LNQEARPLVRLPRRSRELSAPFTAPYFARSPRHCRARL
jgi:hypothetical protein